MRTVSALILLTCLSHGAFAAPRSSGPDALPPGVTRALANGPLRFEPAAPGSAAAFIARGPDYTIGILTRGAAVTMDTVSGLRTVRMTFTGSSAADAKGAGLLASTTNYFRGSDARHWRTGVPNFKRVQQTALYPGIDVEYYGVNGSLEYDLILKAGADPRKIGLNFTGADALKINDEGQLVIAVGQTEVVQKRPLVYQSAPDGSRTFVACNYRLDGEQVRFQVGSYDRSRPLIVDPVLVYSYYYEGSAAATARAVVRDSQGFLYVAGVTTATDLFQPNSPFQSSNHGAQDVFLVKLDSSSFGDGSIVYASYLGGAGTETLGGLAVDSRGKAYLAGSTTSTDFPVAGNAYRTTKGAGTDAFVSIFDTTQTGSGALTYSTFLGGGGEDIAYGLAVSSSGIVYVTGSTLSDDFPTAGNASQTNRAGSTDAFVTVLDPSTAAAVYSGYLGGGSRDEGRTIAVDSQGRVVVAGFTFSGDFPIAGDAYQKGYAGGGDMFVAQIDINRPAPNSLLYSSFYGGENLDAPKKAIIDGAGRTIIAGYTLSKSFPITANAAQTTYGGETDAFVTVLDLSKPATGALVYSTYLGGNDGDAAYDVKADASGVYVAGYTSSANFPVIKAWQSTYGGATDGFVARIDPSAAAGASLTFSSFFGGPSTDAVYGLDTDTLGNVFLTGFTQGNVLPNSNTVSRAHDIGSPVVFVVGLSALQP